MTPIYTWTAVLVPAIGEDTPEIDWKLVCETDIKSVKTIGLWPVWDPLPENPTQDELLAILWAGSNKKDATEKYLAEYLLLPTE